MADWKLGKIQYGFLTTATSGGTLTLVKGSKQYQILTGASNHTVQLPDATVIGASGISFIIVNQSTGIITVNYNDTTLLTTVPAGQSLELLLSSISTANGVWRSISGGGAGGLSSIAPGSVITTNYTIVAADNGRTLNVDTTSGPINITLPTPVDGFKVTIKDDAGTATTNVITIKRAGSELIDFTASDDEIKIAFKSVSLASNGTDWFRVASFVGIAPTVSGRALFGGGQDSGSTLVNIIDYLNIATLGNAVDFGDLTLSRSTLSSCSSSARGLWAGGANGGASNVIDYVTIATTGNAVDFGDLTVARFGLTSCSNSTRGLFGGGTAPSNVIDYVTIATTGNATDFGDLTTADYYIGACASSTRGLFAGGTAPSSAIDYVTIATTGNAASFGNLTVARFALGGLASSTRGLFYGGQGPYDTIDYVTIATLANAIDFGDLTTTAYFPYGTSNKIRGVMAIGVSPGTSNANTTNRIEYVTVATTGNATDFGDLTTSRAYGAACSNAHGGL